MITKPEGSYISYFSNLVKLNGGVNLAQGIPGFQPPEELKEAVGTIINHDVHQYAPGIGNYKLLRALHKSYSTQYDLNIDDFLIVQGATEAISLIYTYLVKRLNGDFSVLSFEPAYESYSHLPSIFGQPYIDFPLDENYSFNLRELEKTIVNRNVKVVFISSPGNPFGKIWSKKEVDDLISMAQEIGFYLIFDGVYKELFFESKPYIPLQHSTPNVFYVNSFSKMFCITGWRVGYLYAHEEHRRDLRSIHDYTGLSAPSILQEALANYLECNDFGESFVQELRENVKVNFNYLRNKLVNLNFLVPPISGGCFIWAKLPSGYNSGFDFAYQLFQNEGVAIIPGEHFSKNHTDWVRLNIARPFQEIDNAAELLTNFIKKG